MKRIPPCHRPAGAWRSLSAALVLAALLAPSATRAATFEGDGAECAGLLQPGQRWAWVRHPQDPHRSVLMIDDGRLLPARLEGDTMSLAAPWPGVDCSLGAAPPPTLALELAPDAAAVLVDAVVEAPTALQASSRPGGLARRAEHWQRARARLASLLAPRAAEPAVAALLLRAEALAAGSAIDAGTSDDEQPLRMRWTALRERLGTSALATAEALDELAAAYVELERPAEGLALLDAEIESLRRAGALPRRALLRVEMLRVRMLWTSQGARRAVDAGSALRDMARATLPPGDLTRWDCEFIHARVLLAAGRRAEATPLLERLATELNPPASLRTALLHDRLAVAYGATGRLSEALLATQRSYLLTIELVGPDHPSALRAINNYGSNLREIGDMEAALPFARQAFEGYRRRFGDGHSASLTSGRGLTLILGELQRPQEALSIIEPQLEAASRRLPSDEPQLLNTRIHQIELLDLVGRHADAAATAEPLLEPVERRFGKDGELTLVLYTLYAGAAARAGQMDTARRALDVAVERIGRIDDQRRALTLLDIAARAAERLGDPARHEELLSRFVALADRADRSGLSEETASWVQQFRSGPHLRWVVMRAQRGETDAAFDLSERFKGRVMLATLGAVASDASPVLPESVRAELAEARRRIRAAEADLSAATAPAARVAAGEKRESAAQAYVALRERVRREHPRFGAMAEAPVLAATDAPKVLPADTCLLSFVMAEAHAGVFVVTRSRPIRWLPLPAPATLDGLVQRVRSAWAEGTGDGSGAAAELASLLEPAVSACPRSARRLVLSPDGALALLPFEPLVVAGRRLVDRFEMGYVQSFSVFAVLLRRAPSAARAGTVLGVGAPTYVSNPEGPSSAPQLPAQAVREAAQSAAVAGLERDPQAARRAFDAMGMRWSPLPGAAKELAAVATLFDKAVVLRGDDATEERLAALNASGQLARYRYLLFATHGFLSYTHPSLSAIVLRQPGSDRYDGYLTAAELPLYRVDSELIVLSACETGVGPVRSGGGVMGLPLALMAAGNRHAIVSLWSVPDRSTAELVTRLFRHLRNGDAPAVALARAKRELSRQTALADPVHWAGFVLYGAR